MQVTLTHDIRLLKVGTDTLQLLRELRNHPALRAVLARDTLISEEEQTRWFATVDPQTNIYFLVYLSDRLCGYALLKHIEPGKHRGEPGILLTDETYYGSSMGGILTLAFLDFCHAFFGIDHFYGNVLHSNGRALGNYRWFDTEIENSDDRERILRSPKPYPALEKINRLRSLLIKMENYDNRILVRMHDTERTQIPLYYPHETVQIECLR